MTTFDEDCPFLELEDLTLFEGRVKNQILLLLMSGHQLNNPSEVKELLYYLPKLKPFRGKFLLSLLVFFFFADYKRGEVLESLSFLQCELECY